MFPRILSHVVRGSRPFLLLAVLVAAWLTPIRALAVAAPAPGSPGTRAPGLRISGTRSAVVHFTELARQEAQRAGPRPPIRPLLRREEDNDQEQEPGASMVGAPAPAVGPFSQQALQLASPTPTTSFMGLDDIPMVDSSFIIIPPDVGGAVGPTRILEGLNNNYRVIDKATGANLGTVGTATFWAPVTALSERLDLTDPRTEYDPYNQRFIAMMQTFGASGAILIGLSDTSDPGGSWHLWRFDTGASIDFPNLGFNKNWVAVAINRFSAGGSFQRGITLVVDYPNLLAGSASPSATLFTQAANSHFCSAPCATYSTTSDTLYVVTHLSSTGATYAVDRITGTAAAPVYTAGGTLTRTGGGWVQPGGNILPQSAPISGSSACGSPPCPIESQDAQVRSAPVFRGGSIWYAQTIGLPSSGLTHTAAQWTKITTPSGAFVEGGRLDDATATSTNGGKWYAYTHVGVNAAGDLMLGFSQFSSAQHPAAGYAMHLAGDPAGSLRDPLIFKAGEDYYHKTFTTTLGRDRWGDFSTVQVDPDEATLWALQQYAKARTGVNDDSTGHNSSRWSTWWAAVGPAVPQYTLGLTSIGVGSVTKVPDQASYASGSNVLVTAAAGTGFAFTGWGGDAVGTTNPLTVTMTSNKNVVGNFADNAPPSVAVVAPNGGEALPIGGNVSLQWTATDNQVVAQVDLTLSRSGIAGPYESIASNVPNTGSFDWTVTGPVTGDAIFAVTATDSATNAGTDGSDASFSITSAAGVGNEPVTVLELAPVWPNPLRRPASISFAVPQRMHVRLTVDDVQGRVAAVLADGMYDPGRYHVSWKGGEAGLFFVRLEANGRTLVRRVAVVR